MSFVQKLVCVCCGREYEQSEVDYFCPSCGYQTGILDVQYDYEAVKLILNSRTLFEHKNRSMWRYLPLLPVDNTTGIQHLQVGWTPLYNSPQLASELEIDRCYIKDEGRNPTASLKDRASAIGVAKAIEKKVRRITCASTGNAASSLAGFAAAAGLPATIFVPARAPQAKLAQLLVYGAQVFAVEGTYDQAWELCLAASTEFGWYNRNCAVNPYLIEGKKTVALELIEQIIWEQNGALPDWVVVSVGDGCTVAGVWKGLWEMYRLGFISRLPKILGVQAEGCQPFLNAWLNNQPLIPVAANTTADSIAVGHPRNFLKGMQAIRKSKGSFIAVSDEEIAWAMITLARKTAVFGEPAAVAGVAGTRKAVREGLINKADRVAIIVTGNGLKDIQSAIKAAGTPFRVKPSLSAVKTVLRKMASVD